MNGPGMGTTLQTDVMFVVKFPLFGDYLIYVVRTMSSLVNIFSLNDLITILGEFDIFLCSGR